MYDERALLALSHVLSSAVVDLHKLDLMSHREVAVDSLAAGVVLVHRFHQYSLGSLFRERNQSGIYHPL